MQDIPDIVMFMRRVNYTYPDQLASLARTCLHPYNLLVQYDEDSTSFEAINRCLKRSKSRYVCICDDDLEFIDENWLPKLIEVMQQHEDIGMLVPIEFKKPEEVEAWRSLGSEELQSRHHWVTSVSWAAGYVMLFDRERTPWIHMDENIPGRVQMSDLDMSLQVRDAGYNVAITAATVVHHIPKPQTPEYIEQYGDWGVEQTKFYDEQCAYMEHKWGNFWHESRVQQVLEIYKK